MSASAAVSHFLGGLDESRCLTTSDLQVDYGGGLRVPTAVACLPDSGVLAVGFDSGQVQTYTGYHPEAAPQPGPCFQLAEAKRSVAFVKASVAFVCISLPP